jgi:hypothetical protein
MSEGSWASTPSDRATTLVSAIGTFLPFLSPSFFSCDTSSVVRQPNRKILEPKRLQRTAAGGFVAVVTEDDDDELLPLLPNT